MALIENIREDLNAIEEAEGYAILNSEHGHTMILPKLLKKRTTISNSLRLLSYLKYERA